MRSRWAALAAAIPLIAGWAMATASPAAAGLPGQAFPAPGGLASRMGHLSAGGGLRTRLGPAMAEQNVVSSSNWAGYADTGIAGQFTSVVSSWVQPAGHCGSGDQYAAFWIGLDGYSSSTVEQAGSEVDCAGRTPRYYAWYEMYPGAEVNFANPVKAGDPITGSVSYQGSSRFRLTLKDTTQRWSRAVTKILTDASRSSAEVIAEAPCCTSGGGILPLTRFGQVSFAAARVNSARLCQLGPVEVTMPGTTVSSLSRCGAFRVSDTGTGSGRPFTFGRNQGGF
jgi:hypothetical protein